VLYNDKEQNQCDVARVVNENKIQTR
jgi:hypothetical protein